jgi:hypothetical protein
MRPIANFGTLELEKSCGFGLSLVKITTIGGFQPEACTIRGTPKRGFPGLTIREEKG